MRQIIGRWSHTTHEQVPLDYVEPQSGIQVIKDIEPYQSMITGERIKSRSDHRAHLRAHGCIEVGNEKMDSKPEMKRTSRDLLRRQLSSMSDSQAGQILNTWHNMSRK
jgi:hypothetical protein